MSQRTSGHAMGSNGSSSRSNNQGKALASPVATPTGSSPGVVTEGRVSQQGHIDDSIQQRPWNRQDKQYLMKSHSSSAILHPCSASLSGMNGSFETVQKLQHKMSAQCDSNGTKRHTNENALNENASNENALNESFLESDTSHCSWNYRSVEKQSNLFYLSHSEWFPQYHSKEARIPPNILRNQSFCSRLTGTRWPAC